MPHTRRATDTDAPAIKALIDTFTGDGTLLPRTEEFITLHADDYIVAEHEGRLVGCVHLDEYAPSIGELRSLAVAPGAQGLGIGKALVLATLELSRKRGHATLFAVSNDEAFFAKYGFARREIPELDRERSEVSKYKRVFAREV